MLRLILVSLIWAFSFGIIKHGLPGVDESFLSFARLLLAFAVSLPFLLHARASSRRHEGTKDASRPGRGANKTITLSPSSGRELVCRSLSAGGKNGGVLQIPGLMILGAIQYGLMYLTLLHSFRFLTAYQVVFFTVFTPLWVTLFSDLLDRRFQPLFLASSMLAVLGTAVVIYRERTLSDISAGFWLMQGSNVCFAAGQVLYRRYFGGTIHRDRDFFGWLYLGGMIITLVPAGLATVS